MNEYEKKVFTAMEAIVNQKGIYNVQQIEYVYNLAVAIVKGQPFGRERSLAIQLMMRSVLAHRIIQANDHPTHYMKMRVMELEDRSEELQSILEKIDSILDNASYEEKAKHKRGIRMYEVSRRYDAEELMVKLSQIGLVRLSEQYKKVSKIKNT